MCSVGVFPRYECVLMVFSRPGSVQSTFTRYERVLLMCECTERMQLGGGRGGRRKGEAGGGGRRKGEGGAGRRKGEGGGGATKG